MVPMDSAQLQGVIQLLLLVGSAPSMVPRGSALSTTAPQPSIKEEGVSSMALAARKSARWKAAVVLQQHVVSVPIMAHVVLVSLMVALPMHDLDLQCAMYTAVEGRGRRALWLAAPPPLCARVSVPNTVAAVEVNAGLQNAHPNPSASSSSAGRMVGMASVHTHQDAARLQSKQVATVSRTPASKWLASGLL